MKNRRSQESKTGEEECSLKNGVFAWSVGQPDKFILGQMLFLCGDGIDALQEAVGILHNLVFSVGSMEDGTEG